MTKVTITGMGGMRNALMEAQARMPREIFPGFAQRMGKTHQRNKLIEQALDRGETIMVVTDIDTIEVRGPGAAKDVTPKAPLQVTKQKTPEG